MDIYLCTPCTPPFSCRFFALSPAEVIAHLPTHPGFAAYQHQHGRSVLSTIPLPARLLPCAGQPAAGTALAVWICTPCATYFTSNGSAVAHMQEPNAAHADTAAIEREVGVAGLYEHVRREHGRYLVMRGAAPVAEGRWLAVNFVHPYEGGQVVVEVRPETTTTRGAIARLVPVDPAGSRVDWGALWQEGLVVRWVGEDGAGKGAVVRTDEGVEACVRDMRLAECWVGNGPRGAG